MTSSMIAGEKKWASARRSGMTVLGKVAVPKPLNLPSQKLENHGLDPNVEIVPKGTLSWGSQSSSVPNAWGSSSVSPNADGSTSSPSYLSGRPSSGSGTRPSTAGSDRAQDHTPNVWGPNSRPSSASGALASNQTALGSLRPHSADTRPGSSQLSRFAEHPPSDNPPTWGPNGSSNKLGFTPSNNDGFSLSSGDFPTLGSEKDSPGKNIDSQELGYNGRPGSSSSRAVSGKENIVASSVGNVKGEPPNTWTRDGPQLAEHAVHPTAERWQGDIPPGGIHHRPPQHFDAWHGPPMNPPPGGWYRGPPRGPPYGGPMHPSGFPVEPFPFYRPQMPLNSSQQVPPGAAPRGHHPKNAELSRPHFAEGYIHPHPRMPMNPGFYPAPVPFEGFYGPPMGYCNPNERDMPFMGMPPGPHPAYKRHPYENVVDSRPRSPVHGPRGKPSTPERMEQPRSGHSDDTRGPYKVLLKQSHNWDEKRAEEEWDHGVPSNIPSIPQKDQPHTPLQRNEWGLEDDLDTYPLGNKPANESKSSKLPHVIPSSPNASSLIQKIDSINAKARNLDGRPDAAILSVDDQYKQQHISGTAHSRGHSHGAQGRVDHRGKRLNNQDDGWRKKPLAGESSAEVSVMNIETRSNVLVHDCPIIELNIQGKDRDHSMLLVDESDNVAQRAKMREMAKQRADKLQKEEEERIREQKAKALAKLEELNRRAHIAEASSQKLEKALPSGMVQQEEEKSCKSAECKTDPIKSNPSSSAIVQNHKDQIRGSNSIMVGENTVVFDDVLLEKPDNVRTKSEVANCEAYYQLSVGSVSRHKQTDYKPKLSVKPEKGVLGKPFPVAQTVQSNYKAANDAAHPENIAIQVASSGEPGLVTISNVITESSTQHKKKNIRSSKNKHKVDDVSHFSVVPSTVAKETNTAKVPLESSEENKGFAKHLIKDVEQHSSIREETSVKGGHQWKSLQPHRMPRNQQGNNRMVEGEKLHSSETVTWAPVRSPNKIEPMDKSSDNTDPVIDIANAKVENVVQNNMKTKRAEMERYRPKPVAKELAQQGNIQQLMVAQNNETTQHGDSAIADMGPTAELKNGDHNQNKSSKTHGSWKQRVYVESTPNQGLQEAGKNIQKAIEQELPLKSDVISSKEKTTDGWNSNEGWNCNDGGNRDNSETSAPINTAVTRVPAQGKKHPYKSNRDTGNSFEYDQCIHGPTDKTLCESSSSPATEMKQMDKNNSLKENRFGGERTPQWQPKTQVHSVHNSRNKPIEGQLDAPANKNQNDQSLSEPVNVVHQDSTRERKPASYRGRPHSPNVGSSNITAESEIAYVKNDQQFSSGFRKNANHNNRSGRGQEFQRDSHFNRERPRQSSHFEYQPVGQYGNNKPNNFDGGSREDSQNGGPKYRERNQGYQRRGGGNFYGRQSGVVHGNDRYD